MMRFVAFSTDGTATCEAFFNVGLLYRMLFLYVFGVCLVQHSIYDNHTINLASKRQVDLLCKQSKLTHT